MITLLLYAVAALFMVINIIIACYAAIRLGYGPPNWQTALNLVVRLTTLQDCLNAGRDWLDEKAPWADRLLNRLRVPKPIIIVDTTPEEMEEEYEEYMEEREMEETDDDAVSEQTEELSDVSEPPREQEESAQR